MYVTVICPERLLLPVENVCLSQHFQSPSILSIASNSFKWFKLYDYIQVFLVFIFIYYNVNITFLDVCQKKSVLARFSWFLNQNLFPPAY